MRRRPVWTLAAALLLAPSLGLAEQPALSPGPTVTPGDVVSLFDAVCLDDYPDFEGSDAVLDGYGFPDPETALPRQHPDKVLQAVVMPLSAGVAPGARSCTVMAAGVGFAAVEPELAPLITGRLGPAERHQDPAITTPHAVWVSRADGLQTKIVLVGHEGATVVAASVSPVPEQDQDQDQDQ